MIEKNGMTVVTNGINGGTNNMEANSILPSKNSSSNVLGYLSKHEFS